MKNFISVLLVMLISSYAFSQDCSVALNTSQTQITHETCFNNGAIKIVLSGDVSLINNVGYKLTNKTTGVSYPAGDDYSSSNTISSIPAGSYKASVRAFCKDETEAFVQDFSNNLIVQSKYKQPIFTQTNVVKTLNAKPTAVVDFSISNGKAPYKIEITLAPFEYNGDTEFSVYSTGSYSIKDLAKGNYTFKLTDDCGIHREVNLTIESVTNDFPRISRVSNPEPGYNYGYLGCDGLASGISHNTPIEISYYLDKFHEYYEVILVENGDFANARTSQVINGVRIEFLNNFKYVDLYSPTNEGRIHFKVKGTNSVSTENEIISPMSKFLDLKLVDEQCDGSIAVTANPSVASYWANIPGAYNLFCFPCKVTVVNKNTGQTVISKENIVGDGEIAGRITSGSYTVTYKAADGFELSKDITYSSTKNVLIHSDIRYCRTNGDFTGLLYLSLKGGTSDMTFPVGTLIRYDSGPALQPIVSKEMLITNELEKVFPFNQTGDFSKYSYQTPVLDGKHKFTVILPCGENLVIRHTSTFNPGLRVSGTSLSLNCSGSGKTSSITRFFMIGVAATSLNATTPKGTKIKCIQAPSGVTINEFTTKMVDSYGTNFFENEGYVVPGNYKFEVTLPCGNIKLTSPIVTVPSYPVYSDFGLNRIEKTCNGASVYLKGAIKDDATGVSQTPYFKIQSLNGNPSGFDKRSFKEGDPIPITNSGTYKFIIGTKDNINIISTSCVSFSLDYKMDVLDFDETQTTAFKCNNESHIFLKGKGGLGDKYRYEILGTNLSYEGTGVAEFHSTTLPNNIIVRIKDLSPEASLCARDIDVPISIIPLSNVVLLSSSTADVCVGSPIKLIAKSLGASSTYVWKDPNKNILSGNSNTITITPTQNGYYYVEAQSLSCADAMRDSVYITMRAVPAKPTMNTPNLEVCYGNFKVKDVVSFTNLPAGHTVIWKDSDNNIYYPDTWIFAERFMPIKLYASYKSPYSCEGAPLEINITMKDQLYAMIKPIPYKCLGEPLVIEVHEPQAGIVYKLFDPSGLIDSKEISGGKVTFNSTYSTNALFLEAHHKISGCVSERKIIVIPYFPNLTNADIKVKGALICTGGNATVELSSPTITNPVYEWYVSQTATTPFHTGNTYTINNITASVTYYVNAWGANICPINAGKRVPVNIIVTGGGAITKQDVAVTYKEIPSVVYVLDNDIPLSGILSVDSVYFNNPLHSGVKGTVKKWLLNTILFEPDPDYEYSKNEKIHLNYQVKDSDAGLLCDIGNIFIMIKEPEIAMLDTCSFKPELIFNSIPNFNFTWQFSSDNLVWNDLDRNKNLSLVNKSSGYYKLKIEASVSGSQYTIFSETLNLDIKTTKIGLKTWYNVSRK